MIVPDAFGSFLELFRTFRIILDNSEFSSGIQNIQDQSWMLFGTRKSDFTVLETRGLLTEINNNNNNKNNKKKKNNNNNSKVTLRTAFRG